VNEDLRDAVEITIERDDRQPVLSGGRRDPEVVRRDRSAVARSPLRKPDRSSPSTTGQSSAIDAGSGWPHTLHMKRTNLVLDPQLLEEAVRLSGERTYSGTVGRALKDFVLRARAGKILELQGQGLWEGDLGAMRGDAVSETRRASGAKGRGTPRGGRATR